MSSRPRVSFVLPVYDEAASIDAFHETLTMTLAAARLEVDVDFVYVDDGSRDDSLARLHRIASTDARVQVLSFSRNFGHQIAVTAGLDVVTADAAIIMDTDLQDPPAVAVELIERWREGFDVVYAQRASRRDSLFKRVTADAYYRLLRTVAEVDIPRDTGDFRLVSRRVIDALRRFPEHHRFMRGLVAWVGFRQTAVRFARDERYAGETGYPLAKMLRFASDGITSFSTFPLRVITAVGWLVFALSLLGILYVGVNRVFGLGDQVPGWTFTIIAILGVGGIQIVMLSVLGSYLGRVYSEVQRRPLYLVASHIGAPTADPASTPTRDEPPAR